MKHKLPSWEKEQKKKKLIRIKRIVKFAFFFILLILFLSFFSIFFLVKKDAFWNARSHLNIVVNSSPLLVLSINPPKDFYVTSLNGDLYAEIDGLGYYRLGKVYELGELKEEGSQLLRKTIQKELKVPIDAVINIDGAEIDFSLENSAVLKSFLKKTFENSAIKAEKGDLKTWDFISLYFSGLVDKLVLINLEAYKKEQLPDGREVEIIDEMKLLSFRNYFLDEEIIDDGLSIAVWNSTKKSGLGKQTAEILTSMGLRVVDVSSTGLKIENKNCLLRANEDVGKTHTFKRIKLIFECDSEEKINEEIRADMVLIIGDD
ncbi:MAG: LytR C-terminal domain-containing protein [Patescibacteria group bacterium]|nr:LytR C-terminal domain-containing protein [Patescibacteria group bacterium]